MNRERSPINEYRRTCPYCARVFIATHMNQKYCKVYFGRKGYCKDRFNHPRQNHQLDFKESIINCLSKVEIPSSIEDHDEALYLIQAELEMHFPRVIPEFYIGGEYAKRIDFCVKKDKLNMGIEIKLLRDLEENSTVFINGLLGQLHYYANYFKKQLAIVVVGELNFRNKAKLTKLESLISEMEYAFIFIEEKKNLNFNLL